MRLPRASAPFAALFAVTALAACDGAAPSGRAAPEAVFDLWGLFGTAARETCASVAADLRLVVTETGGATQTLTRALTPADTLVRLPLTVAKGRTTFALEVRSTNGTLLFSRTQTVDVSGGFTVTLDPSPALTAVLKGCPNVVPLVLNDGAYRGTFTLRNRGPVPTTWRVVRVTPACPPTQTCVFFGPNGSTLKAGETLPVSVSASDVVVSAGRAFDVRFESVVGGAPVGQLDVRFAVN